MVMLPPAVADPMVRPVTVTVTAVLRAMVPAVMVMTIWVAVGATMVPVGRPVPLIVTPKVPVVVKKPDGYCSVIVLLVASAPPAEVVNENVADTFGLAGCCLRRTRRYTATSRQLIRGCSAEADWH